MSNKYNIPENMMAAMLRFINQGIRPGAFLSAVFCNDLRNAIGRADHININLLSEYVSYLYNEAPSNCWGSSEKFNAWINTGGIEGKNEQPN